MESQIEPISTPPTGEHCPTCRQRVGRGAAYCGRCGAVLGGAAPRAALAAPGAGSVHGCPRCGAGRVGGDRYCTACGVDCWALAAGAAPSWSAAASPVAPAGDNVSSMLRASLEGRYLRVGVGLVIAIALGVNALGGLGASDGDGGPRQDVAGATARTEASGASPIVVSTTGPAADRATPTDATANPTVETVAPPPAATQPPASSTAATPAPPPAPVVLEGIGSAVTEPFAYPGGTVRVLSRVTGGSDGCAYIGTFSSTDPANLPSDPSLRTAVLFLEGAGSAEGWVDLALPAGQYYMEIESDCSWVVTMSPT